MITASAAGELSLQPALKIGEVADAACNLFGNNSVCEPLYGGSNAEVFSVASSTGRYVLKFYASSSQQHEFEAYSMSRAQSAGLPVPTVWGRDVLETEHGNRPWLAMEFAAGRSLDSLTFNRKEEANISAEIGRFIARLHAPGLLELDGFYRQTGGDNKTPQWGFRTWSDYMNYSVERLSNDRGYLEAAKLTKTEVDAIIENNEVYRTMTPPEAVFTHADLRRSHVLVDKNLSVTSIIDWGAAQAHGRERDFAKPLCENEEPMISAYCAASGFPRAELDERKHHMRIAYLPGLIIFDMKRGRIDTAQKLANDVRRLLAV